jgi:hypothetical protein
MLPRPNWVSSASRSGPIKRYHLILAFLIVGLLSACQTNLSNAPDLETLSITVEPAAENAQVQGETVSGTIVVALEAEGWMREVRFYLDNQLSLTLTQAPFEYVLDTREIDDGPHAIRIEALMPNRRTGGTGLVEVAVVNGGRAPMSEDRSFSFRGDPNFSRSQLSGEQRAHYDRLWQEIEDSGNRRAIIKQAKSGDIFTYGRQPYSYVQAVLLAFRVTGDLALLDHVDVIAEHMRAQLRDEWYGTLDGTDGTRDGYLNWVDKYDGALKENRGKDLTKINEIMSHATVAVVAYALEANRDLRSPGGRDYGAHADFWKDYLVNHFEAKWRERESKPSAFPILTRAHTTEHHKWLQWHYYMWKLTGHQAYLKEATVMADDIWRDFYPINTAAGPAFVWARSLASVDGSQAAYLQPNTYARHVFGAAVDFHLEGFHNWAVNENMVRFARTFTEFIIDTDDPLKNGFAADVGGGQPRLHLKVDTTWTRTSLARYSESNWAFIGAWDATAEMRGLTATIQERYPSLDTTRLAAALFIDAALAEQLGERSSSRRTLATATPP